MFKYNLYICDDCKNLANIGLAIIIKYDRKNNIFYCFHLNPKDIERLIKNEDNKDR